MQAVLRANPSRLLLVDTREVLTPPPLRPLSQLSCCSQAVVAHHTRLARLARHQGARVRPRLPLFIPSKVALRLLPADLALPEPSTVVGLGASVGVCVCLILAPQACFPDTSR